MARGCAGTALYVRLQQGQHLHLWYIGKRKPVEVLTVRRVRHITASSSWRPASAGNEHVANLPENPASMGLSGQNDMLINGSAACYQGRENGNPIYTPIAREGPNAARSPARQHHDTALWPLRLFNRAPAALVDSP